MTLMPDRRDAGQALVEFSLSVLIFLVLALALFDFGRAIFMYNGVSQAAREIARTASVEYSTTVGASQEVADTIAVQKALVPALGDPAFDCVDSAGASQPLDQCSSEVHYVKVTISAPYSPVTPLLAFMGTFNLTSSSTIIRS